MTGWVVLYFHITSYVESSVNAIHEDTLRRISPIRFVHSSKYDRYYTHLVFYDFMCVCLFRFHVKHINCILCSRRHVIKFLQSLRESAGRGIQCKQARVLEWTQWITLQKKEKICHKCIKSREKAVVSDKNSWHTAIQCCFYFWPVPFSPNAVHHS